MFNWSYCPPWEALFGEKVDYHRLFKHHPGELVEAHMGAPTDYNNPARPQTAHAMVLLGRDGHKVIGLVIEFSRLRLL